MTREQYAVINEPLSHGQLSDILYDTITKYEAQLKAKDEEIERLNCRAYHAEGYINDLHNHPKDKKFYDAKARKIVAMLFWEWKKRKRLYIANGHRSGNAGWGLYEQTNLMEVMFKQAYKTLKDKA